MHGTVGHIFERATKTKQNLRGHKRRAHSGEYVSDVGVMKRCAHLHGSLDVASEGPCPVGLACYLGHVVGRRAGPLAQLLVDQFELLVKGAVHFHRLAICGALDGLGVVERRQEAKGNGE